MQASRIIIKVAVKPSICHKVWNCLLTKHVHILLGIPTLYKLELVIIKESWWIISFIYCHFLFFILIFIWRVHDYILILDSLILISFFTSHFLFDPSFYSLLQFLIDLELVKFERSSVKWIMLIVKQDTLHSRFIADVTTCWKNNWFTHKTTWDNAQEFFWSIIT